MEKAGCIAATKLAWTAVILNGSEASGPLTQTVGYLKCIARRCVKSFEGQRGGGGGVRLNSLDPPSLLAYGPAVVALYYLIEM